MVRAIMKDVLFLKKKAVPATKDDMPVVQDLLEYGICEYCNVKSGDCK